MDKKPTEWVEDDLGTLIKNEVGEDVALEYKRCVALKKQEEHKDELSKDVSAFANAAGGTIVYGMIEDSSTHLPTGLDEGFDPVDISKEWLENVIHQRIKPKINGLHINPVQLSGIRSGKVAYVVTIPQSTTAHQASDKKYYKRYNFKREAMEDYEIRDVMNRLKYPLIVPRFSTRQVGRKEAVHEYVLNVTLRNEGAICARSLKLVLTIPKPLSESAAGGFRRELVEIASTLFGKDWFKNSYLVHDLKLFPDDEVAISDHFYFVYSVDTNRCDLGEKREPFLFWKIYADDMPPQSGEVYLSQIPRV